MAGEEVTLAKLRRLLDAATPGPWDVDWNTPQNVLASDGTGRHVAKAPRDAALIVGLRNSADVLLDGMDALSDLVAWFDEHEGQKGSDALISLQLRMVRGRKALARLEVDG